MVNQRRSPIQDEYIEKYLREKKLDLEATLDTQLAYSKADFVIVAAPTNYDSSTQHFDTFAVEDVIDLVIQYIRMPSWSSRALFQWGIRKASVRKQVVRTFFSALRFLRESKELYDND